MKELRSNGVQLIQSGQFAYDWQMLGYKILSTQENISTDTEFYDWAFTPAKTHKRNNHYSHGGGAIAAADCSPQEMLRRKSRFCAFVFDNPHCATRNRFFELLSRHRPVDAGGNLFRSKPYPVGRFDELGVARVPEFYRAYKFVTAFENSLSLDYASEKLWTALRAQSVPIYWGNVHIARYYNPARFINAFDFDTLESLVQHVLRVDADDALYLTYLSAPNMVEQQLKTRQKNAQAMPYHSFVADLCGKDRHVESAHASSNSQRDMFRRETLSRLSTSACNMIAAQRLRLAGLDPWNFRAQLSRWHIWPHRALYDALDMQNILKERV